MRSAGRAPGRTHSGSMGHSCHCCSFTVTPACPPDTEPLQSRCAQSAEGCPRGSMQSPAFPCRHSSKGARWRAAALQKLTSMLRFGGKSRLPVSLHTWSLSEVSRRSPILQDSACLSDLTHTLGFFQTRPQKMLCHLNRQPHLLVGKQRLQPLKRTLPPAQLSLGLSLSPSMACSHSNSKDPFKHTPQGQGLHGTGCLLPQVALEV